MLKLCLFTIFCENMDVIVSLWCEVTWPSRPYWFELAGQETWFTWSEIQLVVGLNLQRKQEKKKTLESLHVQTLSWWWNLASEREIEEVMCLVLTYPSLESRRHFLNSHCLFSFHEDKPKPKQTRLTFSGKFPSTSLKPSKTLKPSTSQNKNMLQKQV